MNKTKVFLTLSLSWIIAVGYLTWVNALKAPGPYKGFRWDEWLWFGIIPALAPYLLWFIWKPNEIIKLIKCIQNYFHKTILYPKKCVQYLTISTFFFIGFIIAKCAFYTFDQFYYFIRFPNEP